MRKYERSQTVEGNCRFYKESFAVENPNSMDEYSTYGGWDCGVRPIKRGVSHAFNSWRMMRHFSPRALNFAEWKTEAVAVSWETPG